MTTTKTIENSSVPYSQVTNNIKISVTPEHVEESSKPEEGIFYFHYTVTIENLGRDKVQLIERHWVVYSDDDQIAEVVGPGVVGEQPMLESGESFEYTSGTIIHDPIGFMYGTYTFRSGNGKYFEVPIPRFDLFCPLLVH
jgi:ApaG protein